MLHCSDQSCLNNFGAYALVCDRRCCRRGYVAKRLMLDAKMVHELLIGIPNIIQTKTQESLSKCLNFVIII